MRNSLSVAVLCWSGILVLASGGPAHADNDVSAKYETFTVDSVHSSVMFRVTHMGVGPFWGRFSAVKGSVELSKDGEDLKLDIEVPINSVDTGSSNLDGHLQSKDFFHASKYPSATFKSRSARKTSDGTYRVSGDLTIHGVTQAVEVDVSLAGPVDTERGRRCGIETEFILKRGEFEMTYGVEGGTVGDEVRLIVALETVVRKAGAERTGRKGRRRGRGRGADDPNRMIKRIKRMDMNRDGNIESRDVPEMMQPLFKKLDANGDGVASKKEIEEYQEKLREGSKEDDNQEQTP